MDRSVGFVARKWKVLFPHWEKVCVVEREEEQVGGSMAVRWAFDLYGF